MDRERNFSKKEALERVQRAVNIMEEAINDLNETPKLEDPERHEYFSEQCMLFLQEEYGITTSWYDKKSKR